MMARVCGRKSCRQIVPRASVRCRRRLLQSATWLWAIAGYMLALLREHAMASGQNDVVAAFLRLLAIARFAVVPVLDRCVLQRVERAMVLARSAG